MSRIIEGDRVELANRLRRVYKTRRLFDPSLRLRYRAPFLTDCATLELVRVGKHNYTVDVIAYVETDHGKSRFVSRERNV